MKTQPYFQTTINAGTAEERERRIAELTIRGFEVTRLFENTVEARSNRTGLINGRKMIKHKYDGGSARSTYGAVMRKPDARTSE